MRDPVLVVGAGPTGLVLALWLARSGVAVRIVDRNSGPGQTSRAMAVQARTLEFYRQLGVADQIIRAGIPAKGIHIRKGVRQVATFSFGDIGSGVSPFPFVLTLPQDEHERLLVTALAEAGVQVQWNTQLVSLREIRDHVSVTLKTEEEEATADVKYLCGCDGVHSKVREVLGLGFPGGTYQQRFYVADVLANGEVLNEDVNMSIGAHSLLLSFPIRTTGSYRLIGMIPAEVNAKDEVNFDDLRPYVKGQIDVDVNKVNWFSTYRVHHRVAEHFRSGHVFIAGDAAHVHSPVGGQGMNTGIGDAINLGWKLAAVLHGSASEAILDTYETERIAFARSLVATTDRLFELAVSGSSPARVVRSLLIPYLAPVLLHFRLIRRAIFMLVSQIRIHYPTSALSKGVAGRLKGGDRLPWLSSQNNYLTLSSLTWQLHICGEPSTEIAQCAASLRLELIRFECNSETESAGFAKNAAYLIRPDGYIAISLPRQEAARLESFVAEFSLRFD